VGFLRKAAIAAAFICTACGAPAEISTTTRPVDVATRATFEVDGTTADNPFGSARERRDAELFSRWVTAVWENHLFHLWVTWQWEHRALPHPCRDDVERPLRDAFDRWGDGDWATETAWRESMCTPWARNPNGVDSGLFQLSLPLHDDQFEAVGCDPSQWDEIGCGVAAAANLYAGCGRGPWTPPYWCRRP